MIQKKNKIHKTAIISDNVIIGQGCTVEAYVVIDNAIIGNNVHIKSGSVIGGYGFSFKKKDGNYTKTIDSGKVIIKDNVYIGSNTTIDRGLSENTIINKGTIISNLVHVFHNCYIGENVMICSGSIIGGHAHIEDNVKIRMNTTIRNRIKIKNNSHIGMGAVVIKDVSGNTTVVGNPSKKIKEN